MKHTVNHLEKPKALSVFVAIALLSGVPAAAQTYLSQTATKKPRPTDEIKFESQSVSNSFINIENGPLVVTPIKEEAWSSRWHVEPVGEGDFVRIKNKWTGCYLNMEQGPLVCGPKGNEWWSAQWRLVPDVDVKYSIINRWTDCKLTNSGQGLRCMKNDTKTADNLWRPMNLTPEAVAARPAPPAPQKPTRAQQIEWLGTCIVALKTTDGPYPDTICSRAESSNARLGGNWNEDIEVVVISDDRVRFIGYENANFTGNKVTLGCGYNELIGDPENEITSYKVIFSESGFPDVCFSKKDNPHEVTRWDP